jgi:hypothetical protein
MSSITKQTQQGVGLLRETGSAFCTDLFTVTA